MAETLRGAVLRLGELSALSAPLLSFDAHSRGLTLTVVVYSLVSCMHRLQCNENVGPYLCHTQSPHYPQYAATVAAALSRRNGIV
jgi:hypothetical protein